MIRCGCLVVVLDASSIINPLVVISLALVRGGLLFGRWIGAAWLRWTLSFVDPFESALGTVTVCFRERGLRRLNLVLDSF